MHYLLFYEVGEDDVSRRAAFRDAHLEKAWQASERGALPAGLSAARQLQVSRNRRTTRMIHFT